MSTPQTLTAHPAPHNGWINARYASGSPRLRLLCLPHAGAGAGAFGGWRKHLPDGVELAPVELPGRGARIEEPLPSAMEPLVDALLAGLRGELTMPYVLFGHSFGGSLAYELTRRIEAGGLRRPDALVVSAARAPHLPLERAPLAAGDDEQLTAWLRRSGGLPEELLAFPDFLADVLRAVRADLALAEGYRLAEPAPVECPVILLAGSGDDVARPDQVAPWAAYSATAHRMRLLPGGHSFPQTHPEATVAAVFAALADSGLFGRPLGGERHGKA
jgi:surfactin synthase thioesterase subunit